MWEVVKEITSNLLSNSYNGKKTINKQHNRAANKDRELSKKKRQRKIAEWPYRRTSCAAVKWESQTDGEISFCGKSCALGPTQIFKSWLLSNIATHKNW